MLLGSGGALAGATIPIVSPRLSRSGLIVTRTFCGGPQNFSSKKVLSLRGRKKISGFIRVYPGLCGLGVVGIMEWWNDGYGFAKKMLVQFARERSSWAGFTRAGSVKLKVHGPKVRSLEVWITLVGSV